MRVWMTLVALASLTGCYIYQPMIPQTLNAKKLTDYDVSQCVSQSASTMALKRACLTREEIESARNTNIYAHSIAVETLIPAAGLVAYRAARQKSSASTIAISAGAIAGYETLGALAPDNRVEAYARGTKALTCAIGSYRTGVAAAKIAAVERAQFQQALDAFTATKTAILKQSPLPDGDKRAVAAADRVATAIETAVETQSTTGLVDAQLDKFVGQSIEDLNGLLRGTLPTLASLGDSISALQSAVTPPPPPLDTPRDFNADSELAKKLKANLADVRTNADALIKVEAGNQVSVDFGPCLMATTALAAVGLYKPMALGPGNSADKSTIQLVLGQSQRIALIGGVQPYSTNVSNTDPTGDLTKAPTVTITMQGAVLVEITAKDNDTKDLSFLVEIYDNQATKRSVTVKIPKKATPPAN